MEKDEFINLVTKYLDGKTTIEEDLLLHHYYSIYQNEEVWDESVLGSKDALSEKMFSRIQSAIDTKGRQVKAPWLNWRKFSVAASILVVASIGFYFYQQKYSKPLVEVVRVKPQHILPAQESAILTLSDGQQVNLSNDADKTLFKNSKDGVTIDNGTLVYKGVGSNKAVGQNKVEVPRGSFYQIVLADGSKVWLNAQSSLSYPVSFSANERRVTLSGEGYFEISKDENRPFYVESKNQEVKVLGTHFNISAYDDDEQTVTTLIEGSVSVSNRNNQSKNLLPGQQSAIANQDNSRIDIMSVETDESVAWKNGKFIFQKEDYQSIMKKISRWYNVDIIYEGQIPTDQFTGTISRTRNLSTVLESLESAGKLHFRVEGRRVTVLP